MSRRTKGSTFARGYGPARQALRKRWTPQVEAGLVDCAGCGLRIDPGDFWVPDHADDRRDYLGPRTESATGRPSAGIRAGGSVSTLVRGGGRREYGERVAVAVELGVLGSRG